MARITEVLLFLLFLFDTSSQACNECDCCYGENACDAGRKCANGCIAGYWGDKCTESCPENCQTCESNIICTECRSGYTGNQCAIECGKGCINNTCLQSGNCICKSSDFMGRYCSSCSSSNKYGDECNYTCPPNCGACTSQTECRWCKNFFTYGSYCQVLCSVGCNGGTCIKDGSCQKGCKPGFTGNKCDSCVARKYGQKCDLNCPSNCTSCLSNSNCTECELGFYGETCTDVCPPGCHGVCTITNGKCMACKQNLYGDFCNNTKTCKDGFYGINCSKPCTNNDGNCHKCLTNASGSYTGCINCFNGYYPQIPFGLNHSICTNCPSECKNKSCTSKGICLYGCLLGKWGDTCKSDCESNCLECKQINGKCIKCRNGTYSEDCSKICSPNCSSSDRDQVCEIQTGQCINGCSSYSKYGNYCEQSCSETCTNQTCNWKTGHCTYGCVESYHGYFCKNLCASTCKPADKNSLCNDTNGDCISGCENGFHGEMCTSKCSEKCTNKTCDRFTAECLYGCIDGYNGMQCTQENKEEHSTAVVIGSSVGAGAVIIIVIIVVVICFIRNKRRKSTCEQGNIERNGNLKTMREEEEPDKGKDMDAAAIYAKPNKAKGTIVDEANSVYDTTFKNEKTCKGNNEYDVIGAGRKYTSDEDNERFDKLEANALYDITFDNRNKRTVQGNNEYAVISGGRESPPDDEMEHETCFGQNSPTKNKNTAEIHELTPSTDNEICLSSDEGKWNDEIDNHENSKTYYSDTEVSLGKINIEKLAKYVSERSNGDFVKEFETLPKGLVKPYKEASKKENIAKNRYKGIYPYDETRIVLTEGDSDYISASYIDGYKRRKAYIASIGPTVKYMGDMSPFWRMIWQEKADKIVMLTNLAEAGAPKCDKYWPDKDVCLMYADIAVTCFNEEHFADYTVRSFLVQKKDSENRTVHQVHFTAWPDKGTPDDVTSLVEFRQKVNNIVTDLHGPIIVHCSAGIGRSGTYIALDKLTLEGEGEGGINVYECVKHMREQRVNMVQTVEQYQYLHNAVVHTLTFDSKNIAASNFRTYLKTHSKSQLEAKFLQLQSSVEKRSEEETAVVLTNRAFTDKNRQGSDIPGDRNRPRLYFGRTTDSSQYINALFVNSYRKTNRFIVAQTPLPNTVEDFLTLIVQENVSCIISMESGLDKNKTAGCYFPKDNEVIQKGTFTVRSDLEKSTEQYQLRTLKISQGEDQTEEIDVTHIEYKKWGGKNKIPEDPEKFIQFMKTVEQICDGKENKGPILVHCLTGAEKSGLFSVISILLEKTQIDQEVSVVNTVRQIKHRRHMAVSNKEQYIFCHKCLDVFLRRFDTYSNFGLKKQAAV